VKLRKSNGDRWFSEVEEAQLRRLVYRAFDAPDGERSADAFRAIEDWQVETAPERLERHARKAES
jgi:hypothetical protein